VGLSKWFRVLPFNNYLRLHSVIEANAWLSCMTFPILAPFEQISVAEQILEISIKLHNVAIFKYQCRTPDLALNSMRLDRFVNEAQVGTWVFHLLGIEVFAKRNES